MKSLAADFSGYEDEVSIDNIMILNVANAFIFAFQKERNFQDSES